MIRIGVYVRIGEEADKMNGSPLVSSFDYMIPYSAFENLAGFKIHINPLGPLNKNAACAECIMADLTISHILIGREAYPFSMGSYGRAEFTFEKPVKVGCFRHIHGVALIFTAQAYSIHDDQK